MVGIVVVSHSPRLAEAAVALALEMVHGERPPISLAAGTEDGRIGTDPMRVSEAIAEVGSPSGVLVFMDLGSAVLSAELALELLGDPGFEVRLTSAPFVEGLLAGIVSAACGADLDRVCQEASGALLAKRMHLGEEEATTTAAPSREASGAEVCADLVLRNRDGLHARPAAMIMGALAGLDAVVTVRRGGPSAALVEVTGPTALLALGGRQGERLGFSATGPDAEVAVGRVAELFARAFGEPTEAGDVASPSPLRQAPGAGPLGVSPGRVAARVVRLAPPVAPPDADVVVPAELRAAEAERIGPAAAAVADELRTRGAAATVTAGEILRATAQIAGDAGLLARAGRRVLDSGLSAERAVWEAYTELASALREQGGLAAERAADIVDVRDRVVAELEGCCPPGLPRADEPFVLLAEDLSPADAALLDARLCLALVTEQGGPTSHTAIVARSLGIPAVVAARGAWSDPQGSVLLVDGSSGELVWDPDEAILADLGRRAAVPAFSGRGATADGMHLPLLANVGSADEAGRAAAERAEGIGLFRTEFCFLGRTEEPGVDEQVAAYRAVFAAFRGRRVVVRTLDAGSDKPLVFVSNAVEANPALGVRGFRASVLRPDLLERQLDAIAVAAEQEGAEVGVMAPMVTTVDEATAFVSHCHERGIRRAGVMIETPAAALLADRLIPVVDFASIGTNDLTQYVMAADRLVGPLATFNDPWQPAVLTLVAGVARAGVANGVPIGVCGEAAADPMLAAVLAGLGMTSLSMASRAIPAVAQRLSLVDRGRCRAAADAALSARGPGEARLLAGRVLDC